MRAAMSPLSICISAGIITISLSSSPFGTAGPEAWRVRHILFVGYTKCFKELVCMYLNLNFQVESHRDINVYCLVERVSVNKYPEDSGPDYPNS
jgi:hypothetical protein